MEFTTQLWAAFSNNPTHGKNNTLGVNRDANEP